MRRACPSLVAYQLCGALLGKVRCGYMEPRFSSRAGFAVLEDGPFLTLLAPDETLRVVLGLSSEGPRLSFRDEAGTIVWEAVRGRGP